MNMGGKEIINNINFDQFRDKSVGDRNADTGFRQQISKPWITYGET